MVFQQYFRYIVAVSFIGGGNHTEKQFQNLIKKEPKSNRTRYDYNLTIMESPKPATDNRFKK
jgi:hypothetical protein